MGVVGTRAGGGGKVTVSGLTSGNIKAGATITVKQGNKVIASQDGSPNVLDVSSGNIWNTLLLYADTGNNPSAKIDRHFVKSTAFVSFLLSARGSGKPSSGTWTVTSNGKTIESGSFSCPARGDSDVFTIAIPAGGGSINVSASSNAGHELTASLFEVMA